MMDDMSSNIISKDEEEEDMDGPLPGFRFYPTDEELVGFYLRRKVQKKPLSIELIKQIDIYKYDPWDLPKTNNVGDKEWYFFCKRGRKYRNSIRPNRVTSSGFWKATGIDRPIYSAAGENHRQCIGLKKSLVYYCGSAGKGTKTDWMMHEFRLPTENDKSTKHINTKSIAQDAEDWTLCRILKRMRNVVSCIPDCKEIPTKRYKNANWSCDQRSNYINFISAPLMLNRTTSSSPAARQLNPVVSQPQFLSYSAAANAYSTSAVAHPDIIDEILKREDWDELKQLF